MKYGTKINFKNNANKILEEAKLKKIQILVAIGEKAKSIWQREITKQKAVYTGRFRNSVAYKEGKDNVVIGSNVEYAPYIEFDTSKTRGRPTLRNSILNYRNAYKKIAEQIWKS